MVRIFGNHCIDLHSWRNIVLNLGLSLDDVTSPLLSCCRSLLHCKVEKWSFYDLSDPAPGRFISPKSLTHCSGERWKIFFSISKEFWFLIKTLCIQIFFSSLTPPSLPYTFSPVLRARFFSESEFSHDPSRAGDFWKCLCGRKRTEGRVSASQACVHRKFVLWKGGGGGKCGLTRRSNICKPSGLPPGQKKEEKRLSVTAGHMNEFEYPVHKKSRTIFSGYRALEYYPNIVVF